jgi:hypothetical protein
MAGAGEVCGATGWGSGEMNNLVNTETITTIFHENFYTDFRLRTGICGSIRSKL